MWLKINDTFDLRELIVKIDDYEIIPNRIRNLEIFWNINEIYTIGSITFEDSTHMLEHKPIRINDKFKIYAKDVTQTTYSQTFIIVNIEEVRPEKNHVVGQLTFIDLNSWNFIRSFESKGFNFGDLVKISDYFISKYAIDKKNTIEISDERNWGNIESDGVRTHVTPGNVSVINNLYKFMSEGDFLIYQTRDKIISADWNKILQHAKTKHYLRMQGDNRSYIGLIGDFKSQTADGLTTNIVMPEQTRISIDHLKGKKLIKSKENWQKAIEESGKLGTTLIDWVKPNETSIMGYTTTETKKTISTYKNYVNKAIIWDVVVPGTFQRNVGDIIEVRLESLNFKINIDKNMSGDWLIIKIMDKINQGTFTQKLTLARSVQK